MGALCFWFVPDKTLAPVTRLDPLFDYPYRRLAQLLEGCAPGAEPVLMQIGEPQGQPPAFVAEIVQDQAALWSKYPPLAGTADHREAVADWLTARYGLAPSALDPARMVIPVSGTREALFQAGLMAVARAVDAGRGQTPALLMPNPMYHVYYGAAAAAGAEAVPVPATAEGGYLPRIENLDQDLLARTALAYVCTPSNPTGAVATLDELKTWIELARRHDFVLAVDECYSEIYSGSPPAGGLQACAALGGGFDNVLVFNSLSKRSSAPGLRVGFVAGDPGLIETLTMLRGYGGAQVPGPLLAAASALWRDEDHVIAARARYAALFDLADDYLGGLAGYRRPEGAFFLWMDVGDGEAAARRLWGEAGIKVMPGAYMARTDAVGANPAAGHIRVALVHDPDTCAGALDRIATTLGG